MEVRVGILNIGTGKGLASMILISFIMIIITSQGDKLFLLLA